MGWEQLATSGLRHGGEMGNQLPTARSRQGEYGDNWPLSRVKMQRYFPHHLA